MGGKSNDLEQHCSTVSFQNRPNSDTKGAVFVPPFQKVLMNGTSDCQNVSKVSSSFIPPFKKENKDKTDHCNQMDQKMTTSKSHNDSVAQYCDEKNLQEGFKPKSTTSVESVVKMMDSEEKGSHLLSSNFIFLIYIVSQSWGYTKWSTTDIEIEMNNFMNTAINLQFFRDVNRH